MREVRGNYVALINPIFKKEIAAGIIVDESYKEAQMIAQMEKLDKLKVHMVGGAVLGLKPGDEVFMVAERLMGCPRLTIDGINYILAREHDIIFVY